jgi:chromosome segregation ATPase
MASKEPSKNFKFRFDEEGSDHRYQEELTGLRVEKLGQRITFITFLIPCLIGVLVLVGYIDLKLRIGHSQDSETVGVKDLSSNMDSRFSSLSLQYAKLQESFTKLQEEFSKKQAPMDELFLTFEQTTTALRADLKNIEQQFAQQREINTAENEQLEQRLIASQNSLETLSADLQGLVARMPAVETRLQGLEERRDALAGLDEKLDDLNLNLQKTRTLTDVLNSEKTDRRDLENALQREQKRVEDILADLKKSLTEKGGQIDALEAQLKALMKFKEEIEKALKAQSRSPASGSPAARLPSPKPTRSKSLATEIPRPGKIIEQDIN